MSELLPGVPVTEDGQVQGFVHSTDTFGAVDGPGIRFTVFVQGCNMRCKYCHNPDTWKIGVGTKMTAQEIIDKAMPYRSFWGEQGGVTCSGGEILLQIDFVIDLFKKCKEQGISTCLDTCGHPFTREEPWFSKFNELMEYTDILLVDLKHINDKEHTKLTGWTNKNILDMAEYLSEIGKPVWIRHVLVPGITDNDEYLAELGEYVKKNLRNVEKFEVLPYHSYGEPKYEQLGIPYRLKGTQTPTEDRIKNAEKLLHTADYTGYKTWKPGVSTLDHPVS
ncbi:MAG: pyruvate formate-lyase-activating protein [Limosilactobacillus sp.]|uniref:pyruvate formate-lyase-activating protein n=1 Tax=Limosilactobacillus sp. TaxID=2773925 RepID=UPI00270178C0|nr:pyruvate formate-lyase-activating protein [Limosilactobacillus sp.]